jgi:probable rRNA maturation factor
MLETFGEDYQGSDLGDIVISIPKAYRQAKRYKVSDSEEVLRLLIHGMLHLFGYDHVAVSTKKAKQMFDLQNLLLKKNLSDLYRSRKGISCSEIAV